MNRKPANGPVVAETDSLAPGLPAQHDRRVAVILCVTHGLETETLGTSPEAKRSPITRFFMIALAVAAVLQIAATLSEISGVTWLDPRPILIAGLAFTREAASSVFSKLPSP